MEIIKQSYEILIEIDREQILKNIERIGRVCYKSEGRINEDSAYGFVEMLMRKEHLGLLEHNIISVRFITDRGISHEIVRHRLASYAQESTRYCNYANEQFGKQLTFIEPCYWAKDTYAYKAWFNLCVNIEELYKSMRLAGNAPEEIRAILTNSLKTEIIVTMNLREWRHFFKLRTAISAHPQMRDLVIPLLEEFRNKIPIIFDTL